MCVLILMYKIAFFSFSLLHPFFIFFIFFLSSYFSHYFVLLMFCFIFSFFLFFFSPWVMVEFFLRDGWTIPWHVRSGWSSHWEFYRFLCLFGSTKVSPFVDWDSTEKSSLNSLVVWCDLTEVINLFIYCYYYYYHINNFVLSVKLYKIINHLSIFIISAL